MDRGAVSIRLPVVENQLLTALAVETAATATVVFTVISDGAGGHDRRLDARRQLDRRPVRFRRAARTRASGGRRWRSWVTVD